MSLPLCILTHTQWCQSSYLFGKCDRLVLPSSSQQFILWPRDTLGLVSLVVDPLLHLCSFEEQSSVTTASWQWVGQLVM